MIDRTPEEIAAELADVRAARSAFMRGERLSEVQRDGKRIRLDSMKLADFDSAIASLKSEYADAQASVAGRRRRRPIGLAWSN